MNTQEGTLDPAILNVAALRAQHDTRMLELVRLDHDAAEVPKTELARYADQASLMRDLQTVIVDSIANTLRYRAQFPSRQRSFDAPILVLYFRPAGGERPDRLYALEPGGEHHDDYHPTLLAVGSAARKTYFALLDTNVPHSLIQEARKRLQGIELTGISPDLHSPHYIQVSFKQSEAAGQVG
jgi:hypothetical protein